MNVLTPREVYEDPELRNSLQGSLSYPLEDLLDACDTIGRQPDIAGPLDDLYKEDSERWYDIRRVLSGLSPETLHRAYGTEILAWLTINSTIGDLQKKYLASLQTLAGWDAELLDKVRSWDWQYRSDRLYSKSTLLHYQIGSTILHGGLEAIDVPAELRAAARPDIKISDKRANDYTLRSVTTAASIQGYVKGAATEVAPRTLYPVYLDAPVGFVLEYKGRPQTAVAVALSQHSTLMIHQLQGLKGKVYTPKGSFKEENVIRRLSARGLMPLDWQKFMVNVAAQIAVKTGLAKVGIQAGKKNYWVRPQPGETHPHLTIQQAEAAYDKPAKRLGFKKGVTGDWYRPAETFTPV